MATSNRKSSGKRFQDISGRQFGILTAVRYAGKSKYSAARWLCRCACGNEGVFFAYALKDGSRTNCGCKKRKAGDDLEKRFWGKVRKTDTCWEWTGCYGTGGYGIFSPINGDPVVAHRVAYQLAIGPIPKGMCVCHHCDNRKCVRPGHLFIGTHKDNSADMVKKNRQIKGEMVAISKLNPEKVQEIFKRWQNGGISQSQLAREYGVSPSNVRAIIFGLSWRWVTGVGMTKE